MIVDVDAILLVEKKKKKSKLAITTSKELTKIISPTQEGNPTEVAKTSSILSDIGRKNVEILSEKMAKSLVPIVEEVETQLIQKGYAECSNRCGYGEGKSARGS
jgi:hypothetical protein